MADIYVATTGNDTTGDGSSGNPYATPGKAGGVAAASDRILIQSGAYVLTSTTPNAAGGPLRPPAGVSGAPTVVLGYSSTPGDLDDIYDYSGFPSLSAQAIVGVASPISSDANFVNFYNLSVSGASQATHAFLTQGNNNIVWNCLAQAGTTNGFLFQGSTVGIRLTATQCVRGINLGSGGAGRLAYCIAFACTGAGFYLDSTRCALVRCIAYANTGGSTDGFFVVATTGPWMDHCIAYDNGRDGFRFSGAGALDSASIRNCVSGENAGTNYNSTATDYSGAYDIDWDYNAVYTPSGTARTNVPTGTHDVTLSGDPFIDSANGDFALNTTAGAGAALRAAGYPGTFPNAVTIGYVDIGAAQHQDSGGSGGGLRLAGRGGLAVGA